MRSLEAFLGDLIDKMGQGTVADKIGVDASLLSRFRSGQGSMGLEMIERLLILGDGAIMSRSHLRRLEDALETVSALWAKARKGEGNGRTRMKDIESN